MKKKIVIAVISVILLAAIGSLFIKPARSVAPTIYDITATPRELTITPAPSSDVSDTGAAVLTEYLSSNAYIPAADTDSGKLRIPLTNIPVIAFHSVF